jgi:pentatricopeptide repeat protein
VWRAFRRTQRAADALSLLRRLEAAMDTPTEGPPTTIMNRTGGGAGEAGNGRNKGGKTMGGGSGRMAEGERDEETVHDTAEETAERYRVPAAAYDGVLTVLCDAKQRDAALDLFEHMLHEVGIIYTFTLSICLYWLYVNGQVSCVACAAGGGAAVGGSVVPAAPYGGHEPGQ